MEAIVAIRCLSPDGPKLSTAETLVQVNVISFKCRILGRDTAVVIFEGTRSFRTPAKKVSNSVSQPVTRTV